VIEARVTLRDAQMMFVFGISPPAWLIVTDCERLTDAAGNPVVRGHTGAAWIVVPASQCMDLAGLAPDRLLINVSMDASRA
jgi:hypothetical protein